MVDLYPDHEELTKEDIDLLNRYFLFLLDRVKDDDDTRGRYIELLRRLHKKEFYYILPMDKNRADDGKGLRDIFAHAFGLEGSNMEALAGPASCLEVLIALAERCENDIVHEDIEGDRSPDWFWKWCANLGLLKFTDETIVEWLPTGELDICLDRWMERKFEKNGKGSPFPISITDGIDFRKEEMWRQMHHWISENVIFIERLEESIMGKRKE